jgi:hemolysin III
METLHDLPSRRNELANSMTHALGAVLALAALVIMVVFASLRGTAADIVGASLFGATLVLLYSLSTAYHSLRKPTLKKLFRILDHSAIFLLIAGTYTPFCLATLKGPWGWSILVIIWGLALLGVLFKAVFGPRLPVLSTVVYLAMGWLVLIAIFPLWKALPGPGLLLLFGGGAFYSGGVVFYQWHKLPYHHAVWHLFVIAGSACHVAAVLGWVIPGQGR